MADSSAASVSTGSMQDILDALNTSDPAQAADLVRVMKHHLARHFRARKALQRRGFDGMDDALERLDALSNRVDALEAQQESTLPESTPPEQTRLQEARASDAPAEPNDALYTPGLHALFEEVYAELNALHEALDADSTEEALQTVEELTDGPPSTE